MIRTLKSELGEIKDVYIADTFFKRLSGFMFRSKPHHKAILFKPCSSIHTFFMKFNIDVLFLNKDMKVVKKIENLPPKKVIMPVKEGEAVIEGRSGLFKDFKVNDKVGL